MTYYMCGNPNYKKNKTRTMSWCAFDTTALSSNRGNQCLLSCLNWAPELSRVLVFSFLWQGYRYLYSLQGLQCLFWWIDLLRCMLLQLFPLFSLMSPLYVSMQGSLSKESCFPDHPFSCLHLDQLKVITSFVLQDYILIPTEIGGQLSLGQGSHEYNISHYQIIMLSPSFLISIITCSISCWRWSLAFVILSFFLASWISSMDSNVLSFLTKFTCTSTNFTSVPAQVTGNLQYHQQYSYSLVHIWA